jgi:hypothetical protein
VKAVLRALHSPDADDLPNWRPPDEETWEIFVQAFLGPSDGPGEESFDFTVSSAAPLSAEAEAAGHAWTGSRLILGRWNYAGVERAVIDLCEECEGPDWSAVAAQLARYMDWEFTNYRDA